MFDFAFLERLLDLLHRSDAHTIEIRRWTTTIRISKGGLAAPAAPVVPAEPPKAVLIEIQSPMVGTFYAQPEPGSDPYVRIGSRIKPGQTLCIIEAMKIMNPLDAEVAGVIREIPAQDAQPVEFGQVLFRVDPNG